MEKNTVLAAGTTSRRGTRLGESTTAFLLDRPVPSSFAFR